MEENQQKVVSYKPRRQNDWKERGVIIFKILSKVTDKNSLNLRVGNSWVSLAKLGLGRSLVLRWC